MLCHVLLCYVCGYTFCSVVTNFPCALDGCDSHSHLAPDSNFKRTIIDCIRIINKTKIVFAEKSSPTLQGENGCVAFGHVRIQKTPR